MDDRDPVTGTSRAHECLGEDDVRLLSLLADGLPTLAVARSLNTSPRTLQRRTRELCDRIGVRTPVEAVAWAARRRLI